MVPVVSLTLWPIKVKTQRERELVNVTLYCKKQILTTTPTGSGFLAPMHHAANNLER